MTCNCVLCQFEIINPIIVGPAIKITQTMYQRYQTLESRDLWEAIEELRWARLQLYELFDHPIRQQDFVQPRAFSSRSPSLFDFARLLQLVLWILYSSLREQENYHEAVPYYAVALTKGNLVLRHGSVVDGPIPAFYVWGYHRMNPRPEFSGPIASRWLQEVKEMCSMVGGEHYYEKDFSKNILHVEASLSLSG